MLILHLMVAKMGKLERENHSLEVPLEINLRDRLEGSYITSVSRFYTCRMGVLCFIETFHRVILRQCTHALSTAY